MSQITSFLISIFQQKIKTNKRIENFTYRVGQKFIPPFFFWATLLPLWCKLNGLPRCQILSTYNVIWHSYYESKKGYELLAHPVYFVFFLQSELQERSIFQDHPRDSISGARLSADYYSYSLPGCYYNYVYSSICMAFIWGYLDFDSCNTISNVSQNLKLMPINTSIFVNFHRTKYDFILYFKRLCEVS